MYLLALHVHCVRVGLIDMQCNIGWLNTYIGLKISKCWQNVILVQHTGKQTQNLFANPAGYIHATHFFAHCSLQQVSLFTVIIITHIRIT